MRDYLSDSFASPSIGQMDPIASLRQRQARVMMCMDMGTTTETTVRSKGQTENTEAEKNKQKIVENRLASSVQTALNS